LHRTEEWPIIAIYEDQYYNSEAITAERLKGKCMQCPHCGNELSGATLCSKCGRRVSLPKGDIEVEYKEFKVSELLEIRKSQQAAPNEGTTEPGTAKKGDPFSPRPPAKVTEKPAPWRGTKRVLIAFLLVLIFFGLVAGAYYFLRFLL
jgi:hypothetical protein